MSLVEINEKNPQKPIFGINDERFKVYGKVLGGYNVSEISNYTENNIAIPEQGNIYVASNEKLESFDVIKMMKRDIFGNLEIEAGECAGQNTHLTGVEYHQGSEVTIAVTDGVLVLGKVQDIVNHTYDSAKTECFFLPKGTAIELYGTTLHYSPCKVWESGFMTIVLLIKGTNALLPQGFESRNQLLTKTNKFLMVHSSQKEKVTNGVIPGLFGDMVEIQPLKK